MSRKALIVIDIQNDITKNYREIISNLNAAIDWAAENCMAVVYIRRILHYRRRRHGLREIHLLQHGEGRLPRSCDLRLRHQL